MSEINENKFAFVIMPFSPSLNSVYNDLIRPALESCEIDCVRADEEVQGHIHSQMLQRIFESAVVIADITGQNANVFYELGVAHSCGCKTIVICDSAFLDKVPFDIAPYRVFSYKNPDHGNVDPAFSADDIGSLSAEIKMVLKDDSEGIPNPVQDYLASQSPVHSTSSLFINQLDAQSEEQLIRNAKKEIIYYGITANSFSDLLTGIVETEERIMQLSAHLCLLDPEAHDCWEFLYSIFSGGIVDPVMSEQYRVEDIQTQKRAIRRLDSLANTTKNFSVHVHYYKIPPVFWAYVVDQQRLVLGHLAMQRSSARHLPVNILVKEDRSTHNLFTYYHDLINSVIN